MTTPASRTGAAPRTEAGRELWAAWDAHRRFIHGDDRPSNIEELIVSVEAEAREPALDVERVAEWLHKHAATRRVISCGPESTGCRQKHRLDARDLIESALATPSSDEAEPPLQVFGPCTVECCDQQAVQHIHAEADTTGESE